MGRRRVLKPEQDDVLSVDNIENIEVNNKKTRMGKKRKNTDNCKENVDTNNMVKDDSVKSTKGNKAKDNVETKPAEVETRSLKPNTRNRRIKKELPFEDHLNKAVPDNEDIINEMDDVKKDVLKKLKQKTKSLLNLNDELDQAAVTKPSRQRRCTKVEEVVVVPDEKSVETHRGKKKGAKKQEISKASSPRTKMTIEPQILELESVPPKLKSKRTGRQKMVDEEPEPVEKETVEIEEIPVKPSRRQGRSVRRYKEDQVPERVQSAHENDNADGHLIENVEKGFLKKPKSGRKNAKKQKKIEQTVTDDFASPSLCKSDITAAAEVSPLGRKTNLGSSRNKAVPCLPTPEVESEEVKESPVVRRGGKRRKINEKIELPARKEYGDATFTVKPSANEVADFESTDMAGITNRSSGSVQSSFSATSTPAVQKKTDINISFCQESPIIILGLDKVPDNLIPEKNTTASYNGKEDRTPPVTAKKMASKKIPIKTTNNIKFAPTENSKMRTPTTDDKSPLQRKSTPYPKTLENGTFSARKMPNFEAIHKKQFQKMESLVKYKERKAERAKTLISFSKSVTYSSKHADLIGKKSAIPVRNYGKSHGLSTSTNTTLNHHKICEVSTIREKNAEIIKGVRSNRRFMLQMQKRKLMVTSPAK